MSWGSEAQLAAVAFGCGPGSFTGVRIAASAAQGIALARGTPVIAVSSLACLAAGALRLDAAADVVVATIAGRKGEMYTCAYARGSVHRDLPVALGAEVAVPIETYVREPSSARVVICGDAMDAVLTRVPHAQGIDWRHPHAQDLLRIARAGSSDGDLAAALPVYLEGSGQWRKLGER
ncbi:MAG: tRNA (adenosine(37)-N6)-threonylcarbamoyltransferase complex dimerization subunit type 1 TsaB [Gammaproteobacteria bacterium]|nr:tRNA (adenosine(37)-N6)-threonylcarbamoyltransferase complex dimerization subunit type 1 TsaB [Gammaproteobacteria bacterium]